MVTYLHVRARTEKSSSARLQIGESIFPCIIGRSGRGFLKREGDGKSPIGVFDVGNGFFRQDRLCNPYARGPMRPLRRNDGWCEVPGSGKYNQLVKLPFRDGHETMWRQDEAYDIVFSTSHNQRPRVQGLGSAIFFHLTREGSQVTAGCVAVSRQDMNKILSRCGRKIKLVIWPCQGLL
jgi:L,D-peptidoglycan transpeptidase YkuD (ErfK/YbiS/YcfS/YnhG family)